MLHRSNKEQKWLQYVQRIEYQNKHYNIDQKDEET